MSDDNKNLSDDLDDMLDDTKDSVKRTGDRITKKTNEFSKDAKEFGREAKEKASDFTEDAKKAAKEFTDDAREVLSDGKNVGIIAHLTIIGWIVALIMNGSNKTEFGSFYIRQMLGLCLVGIALSWIPILGFIVAIVLIVAWIMSLVSALGGTMKPTFLLGEQFQEWFKAL